MDFRVAERCAQVAEERGLPRAQVTLAWFLHQEGVTAPIVGTTRLHHLEEAVGALEVELSDDERRRLEEPYVAHPVLGHG